MFAHKVITATKGKKASKGGLKKFRFKLDSNTFRQLSLSASYFYSNKHVEAYMVYAMLSCDFGKKHDLDREEVIGRCTYFVRG